MDYPALIKGLAQATKDYLRDSLEPMKQRLKQIETQGETINSNFADINARLSAIEDMLTDPGTRA